MGHPQDESDSKALRLRGRRAGIIVFSVLVTAFTVVCSAQLLWQVYSPEIVPSGVSCPTALRGLVAAIDRARVAAANETGGERAAVQRFRSALQPDWASRAALDRECGADRKMREGLKLVDWLRYAEEHAVRYEALDVAQLRRKTLKLMAELRTGPSTGSGP